MESLLSDFYSFILSNNITTTSICLYLALNFNTVINKVSDGVIQPGLSYFTSNKKPFHLLPIFTSVITFVLTALFIYLLIYTPINKLQSEFNLNSDTSCPYCFTLINNKCLRCPACTSNIEQPLN